MHRITVINLLERVYRMENVLKKRGLMIGLLVLAVAIYFMSGSSLPVLFTSGPLWTYLVIIGIIGSGYMAVKYTLEDRKIDEEWIEQEGQVYMERLEEAKKKKNKLS